MRFEKIGRDKRRLVCIAISIFVFAVAIRFYKLGEWPFVPDEIATIEEESLLFGRSEIPNDHQYYRLPKIIPLAYLLHHIDYSMFGSDELGSRVIPALMSSICVLVIFLMINPLKGLPTAVATSLIFAVWPSHVSLSQQNRYYAAAAFFSTICLLAGAYVADRRSIKMCFIACLALVAAVLCNTLTGAFLGIVLVGIIGGSFAERQNPPGVPIMIMGITAIGLLLLYWHYLRPLITGWNEGAECGYSVTHAILGSVNLIGWPTAVLGSAGTLFLLTQRSAQNWYWIASILGCAVATVLLPMFFVFSPYHILPFSVSVVCVAGFFVGAQYEILSRKSRWVGIIWIIVPILLSLPSLLSHYRDGSRCDYRTAAHYVEEHWLGGDRVTAPSIGLFRHYAPNLQPSIALAWGSLTLKQLSQLAMEPGRLWIVLESFRGGLNIELRRWLGANCTYEFRVQAKRFDYHEQTVEVFLCKPLNCD